MPNKTLVSLDVSSSKRVQLIDITDKVASLVKKNGFSGGICLIYVPHTTAAVTINENADPSVRTDLIMGLGKIVPDNLSYDHAEGNSPAHIKSSLVGSSRSVIINNGGLLLGRWQGIYFCEFDGPRQRKVYVKLMEG